MTNTLLFKQLPYDPHRDFMPVAFVARSPFAVLVEAGSPVRTIDDLVGRAKAADGGYTLGNEGPRTFSGMIARLFNARTQAGANLVGYASVGTGVQDLIGGHVNAMVADVASAAPLVKQGRLRLLATTSAKRLPGLAAVPALAERLPGFDMVGWFAVAAPAGTPDAVVQRVNADLNRLLAEADVAERIAVIGPIAEPGMTPTQVAAFLADEHRRWTSIAAEIGLLPE